MQNENKNNDAAEIVMRDLILPFDSERLDIRGRYTRLEKLADTVLTRHDYPEPVSRLLAELLVLASTFSSMLKYDGVFTLQVSGDGPVNMLVADFVTPGTMRGYAQFDQTALNLALTNLSAEAREKPDFRKLVGKQARLMFTVDQGNDTERYQGIVALDQDTLTESAKAYFRHSEQLPTLLTSAVDRDENGKWRAASMMVQRIPRGHGETWLHESEQDDDWAWTTALIGTLSDTELLNYDDQPAQIVHSLFHEPGYRLETPRKLEFGCRCSRDRVESVLRQYDVAELEDLAIEGRIAVNCEFCNASWIFTPEQLSTMDAANENEETGSDNTGDDDNKK